MTMVHFESDPDDPRVFVDGEFYGHLSRWQDGAVVVPTRSKRLELRSEGYYQYRRDLNLEPGRTYTLSVQMVRKLE